MGISKPLFVRSNDPLPALERVAVVAARAAERLDDDLVAPHAEIKALSEEGLLLAPFTPPFGGAGFAPRGAGFAPR